MKTLSELSYEEVAAKFSDEKQAREFLENIRWPHGIVCPHCNNKEQEKIWKIEENKKKKIRAGLYHCRSCNKQFTVTVGTIFEDSHIPLGKWLTAWHMLCCSKKGIPALQIQRMLKLGSYRSAHFMMHRIRHALLDPVFDKKLGGTVEVDEAYIGGSPRSYTKDGRILSKKSPKQSIISLVERQGEKRSLATKITAKNLHSAIETHVAPYSAVCTDESNKYKFLPKKFFHHSVNHGRKQYALKFNEKFIIHSNTVESSFALLKRGIIGAFHHISPQYLPHYLAEFDFRWNTKKNNDGERTVLGLHKISGKRLIYGKKRQDLQSASQEDSAQNPRRYDLRGNNDEGGQGFSTKGGEATEEN